MNRRLRVAVIVATAGVLLGLGGGVATTGRSDSSTAREATKLTPGSYKVNTKLNTRLEVPRPKGTTRGTGTFTGTLKVVNAKRATLAWRLTFARLTGPATAAHVHLGAPGKAGKVVVPLCGPCRSGRGGTRRVSAAAATAMIAGRAYVNVHTKRNPGGEIRGTVKAAAPAGSSANPYANIKVAVTPKLVAQGKALSDQFGCEACHTLTGAKSSGPTWKGLAGRNVRLTTGQVVKATDGYLINAIVQPDAEIVEGYSSGIMSTAIGNIPLAQAKAIVAFIKSLK
ncbi:MAG TPA: CHRD domain-containing protein [Gaiella sp.]